MFSRLIKTFLCLSLIFIEISLAMAEEAATGPVLPDTSAAEAVVDEKYKDCDAKLKEELTALIKKDKDGILALQFKLTVLKLAKQTSKGNYSSLEALARSDSERLAKFDKANPEVLTKLESLYDEHARVDLAPVLEHIEDTKEKSKAANHYKAKTRLMNDDVASLLLHDQLTNEKTEVTKMDVAIAWYMRKVTSEVEKKYGEGSAKANLTNISNQVQRYLGTIVGTDKASVPEIESEMKKVEAEIQKFLTSSVEEIKKNLVSCFDDSKKWKGQCELSTDHINKEVSELLYDLNNISAEMGAKIAQSTARKDTVPVTSGPGIVLSSGSAGGKKGGATGEGGPNASMMPPLYTPAGGKGTVPIASKLNPAQIAAAQKTCEEKIIRKKSVMIGMNAAAIEKGKKFLVMIKDIQSLLKAGPARHKDKDKEKEIELKYEGIKYNICCNGVEEEAMEEAYTLAFFYVFDIKFFYGIPHGAEIGIKGNVELGAEGQLSFKSASCDTSKCGAIGIRMHPSLSIYAEVASGLVAVEGGIKWEPKIELEQCKENPMPPATFNINVGLILLYYQATYGWAVTVDDKVPINHVFGLKQNQGIEKKIQIF